MVVHRQNEKMATVQHKRKFVEMEVSSILFGVPLVSILVEA